MNTLQRIWDNALYYFGVFFTLTTIFYAFAAPDKMFESFVSAMLCFIMHRLDQEEAISVFWEDKE